MVDFKHQGGNDRAELKRYPMSQKMPVTPFVSDKPESKKSIALDLEGSYVSADQFHSSQADSHTIVLPNQEDEVRHFGLDIGGSLAKLVYFANSRIHFVKFLTKHIEECIEFIKENDLHINTGNTESDDNVIHVTGGGSYKYSDLFEKQLGVKLAKHDEMESLICGCNFLLQNMEHECFAFAEDFTEAKEAGVKVDPSATQFKRNWFPLDEAVFPYLLVNIGSGVSIVKVNSSTSYERIDGTSLGGGTFWGLCYLLTGCTNFDDMLDLTTRGNSRHVDLCVGDIYGKAYTEIGLPEDVIASSFGRVMYSQGKKGDQSEEEPEFCKADLALALLRMITINIGQLAYHNARCHNLKRICFGGHFTRSRPVVMSKLSFAINFWSRGEMKALFLLHEGYLGGLGAFLLGAETISSPRSFERDEEEEPVDEDIGDPNAPPLPNEPVAQDSTPTLSRRNSELPTWLEEKFAV